VGEDVGTIARRAVFLLLLLLRRRRSSHLSERVADNSLKSFNHTAPLDWEWRTIGALLGVTVECRGPSFEHCGGKAECAKRFISFSNRRHEDIWRR
jgi:hypothetical protein